MATSPSCSTMADAPHQVEAALLMTFNSDGSWKKRRKKHSYPRVKNGIPLNCLADLDLEEKKQMFPHFHFAWKIIQSLHLSLLFEDKLLKLRIWLTRQELSSLQCMAASRLHQLLHLQGWLETSRVLGERAAIIIIMQFPGVTIFVLRIS